MSQFILMENKTLKTEEKRQTGYIYKIVALCDNFDDADTYYGSTFNKLSDRMAGHRRQYKQWKAGKNGKCQSFELFDKYSVENCKILLIETLKDVNKRELTTKEYGYIFGHPCINKCGKSGIIAGDKQEYKKEYYKINVEKIKEYNKQYCEANQEIIKEKKQNYRKANKEKIQEYYEAIKDKLAEKQGEKHSCICGGKYTLSHKAKHEKTNKHQTYLQATQ